MSEAIQLSGISLPTLARLTGYPLPTVKHWSSGRRKPNAEQLAAIARAFRDHADQLLDKADTIDPPPDRRRRSRPTASVVPVAPSPVVPYTKELQTRGKSKGGRKPG